MVHIVCDKKTKLKIKQTKQKTNRAYQIHLNKKFFIIPNITFLQWGYIFASDNNLFRMKLKKSKKQNKKNIFFDKI